MEAKILQFDPPRLKRLVGYRFVKFWLYVSFVQSLTGRKIDSPETVMVLEKVARKVTHVAVERGLL